MLFSRCLTYLVFFCTANGVSVAERKGRGDIDCSTCNGPHADRLWCPVYCGTRIGYSPGAGKRSDSLPPVEFFSEFTERSAEEEGTDDTRIFDQSIDEPEDSELESLVVRVDLQLTPQAAPVKSQGPAPVDPSVDGDKNRTGLLACRSSVYFNETTRSFELTSAGDRRMQATFLAVSGVMAGIIALVAGGVWRH